MGRYGWSIPGFASVREPLIDQNPGDATGLQTANTRSGWDISIGLELAVFVSKSAVLDLVLGFWSRKVNC